VCTNILEKVTELNRARMRDRKSVQRQLVMQKGLQSARGRGESLFPYFRLLLPHLDSERGRYQIKLADIYIRALAIDDDSHDAKRLKHFKDPETAARLSSASRRFGGAPSAAGDFALVLHEVLTARESTVGNSYKAWTVGSVNEWLDKLVAVAGGHGRVTEVDEQRKLFVELLAACKPVEHKWIVRVVLGDMKLGLRQDSLLGWYHPDAMECFNSSLSLRTVFEDAELRDPAKTKRFTIKVRAWA
jgi:DNA ligase-4